MSIVPFEVESLDAAQQRFFEAIQDLYDGTEELQPGDQRKHIFDSEDGLRLIVSKDRHPRTGVVGIHFSAMVEEHAQFPLNFAIRDAILEVADPSNMVVAAKVIDPVARERFKLLSGYEGEFAVTFPGWSVVLDYNVPLTEWVKG